MSLGKYGKIRGKPTNSVFAVFRSEGGSDSCSAKGEFRRRDRRNETRAAVSRDDVTSTRSVNVSRHTGKYIE